MSLYDVPQQELVEEIAQELKEVDSLQPPKWADFVKTGNHKENPPLRDDWWYVRAASIMRRLAKLGPIGVSKLRTHYGGRKNRGFAPEKFKRAGGKHIRKILQQLEEAGLAEQTAKGVRKGRVLTSEGQSFLDKISEKLMKKHDVEIPEKPNKTLKQLRKEAKKEAKKKKEKEEKEKKKKKQEEKKNEEQEDKEEKKEESEDEEEKSDEESDESSEEDSEAEDK